MRRPLAITLLVALFIVSLVAACGPGSAPPSASPAGATAAATAAPGATATAAAADPTPNANEPPPASLAVEGGDPVAGQLGSFTWGDGGSDSPWLPGAPIHVGTGERLTMTVADRAATAAWSVRRTRAGQIAPPEPVPMAEAGGGPIGFVAPPPGRWSVQVVVRFAGAGTGSATYYWLIEVD